MQSIVFLAQVSQKLCHVKSKYFNISRGTSLMSVNLEVFLKSFQTLRGSFECQPSTCCCSSESPGQFWILQEVFLPKSLQEQNKNHGVTQELEKSSLFNIQESLDFCCPWLPSVFMSSPSKMEWDPRQAFKITAHREKIHVCLRFAKRYQAGWERKLFVVFFFASHILDSLGLLI